MWDKLLQPEDLHNDPPDGLVLHAYLLGLAEFEAIQRLQRKLVYEVSGDRHWGALILCEHAPLISVGRQGSSAHIHFDSEDLANRGWPVRWVNRGGGCILHLPGQLAIYPILPLRILNLGLQEYLDRLHEVLRCVLADFSVRGECQPDQPGLWVRNRQIAAVGVAVRDWVSWYGAVLNVAPDLVPFRSIRPQSQTESMTSLVRERGGPVRMTLVRQSLLEHFARVFALGRTSLFFSHPLLTSQSHQRVRVAE